MKRVPQSARRGPRSRGRRTPRRSSRGRRLPLLPFRRRRRRLRRHHQSRRWRHVRRLRLSGSTCRTSLPWQNNFRKRVPCLGRTSSPDSSRRGSRPQTRRYSEARHQSLNEQLPDGTSSDNRLDRLVGHNQSIARQRRRHRLSRSEFQTASRICAQSWETPSPHQPRLPSRSSIRPSLTSPTLQPRHLWSPCIRWISFVRCARGRVWRRRCRLRRRPPAPLLCRRLPSTPGQASQNHQSGRSKKLCV